MTIDRAIEILTPAAARYSPQEYEDALGLARWALGGLQKMYRLDGLDFKTKPEDIFPDAKVFCIPRPKYREEALADGSSDV